MSWDHYSDEDIDHELGHMQERNSRIVTVEDKPVEKGNIAVIDFEGFVDEKAFEGGKAEGYELSTCSPKNIILSFNSLENISYDLSPLLVCSITYGTKLFNSFLSILNSSFENLHYFISYLL